VRARLLVLLAATLAAWPAAAVAGPAERASASGLAILVRVPGQADAVTAVASAPPRGSVALGATAVAGGSVSFAAASTVVETGPGSVARAQAVVELRGITLFDGAVTIERVVAQSSAVAAETGPGGDFAGSLVEGLQVAGSPIAAAENARVELGGYGYAVMLEQAVQREDAAGPGYRGFVTAMHVYLTKDHGGLPAGSEILIGYGEAAVRGEAPQAAPASEPPAQPPADEQVEASIDKEPTETPPGAPDEGPPPIVRDPPADVRPDITGQGFVFPVYGPASFSDDFAAPRADTIWHHGNDIFAPLGAPVLAVTDGELFLVGWNGLGGHRLWLRDDAGNEYYYAHLSAYSSIAANGARVEAGAVLGFVGESGVAGGVPHLHFEVHPAALLGLGYDGVINPYTYLLAWEGARDRTFSVAPPPQSGGKAPAPGAVMLDAEDISTVSGLDPEAVERALELPLALELGVSGPPPRPPELIGAPVGFPAS
jgi:murein DD-endopeptidase MepM/ murein hydrolase activator NlpD